MTTPHHSDARPDLATSLSRWVRSVAAAWGASRAEARLQQAARADHRVMAECLQAGGRDLSDETGLAQSWGRFPEQLPDGRGAGTHLRHC